MAENTYHDNNHIAVLAVVSNVDGKTIVLPWGDPVTHRILVSPTGGGATIYTETPAGAINSINVTYTTVHNINTVYSFAINGEYVHPQDLGAGTGDYTVSGSTITMLSPLPASLSGSAFTIVYS